MKTWLVAVGAFAVMALGLGATLWMGPSAAAALDAPTGMDGRDLMAGLFLMAVFAFIALGWGETFD